MDETRAELQKFFSDKAKHLQNEIDLEIEKIGGEGMLISREDLIHWVYESRRQIGVYQTVCRMLEDDGTDESIRQELLETLAEDQREIHRLQERKAREEEALEYLQRETEIYGKTLGILARQEQSGGE